MGFPAAAPAAGRFAKAIEAGRAARIEPWIDDWPDPAHWLETAGIDRARRAALAALAEGPQPIVVSGPPGHGKTLLLRSLWNFPPPGLASIFVPFADVEPGELAAWILSSTRTFPVRDPTDALVRLLRTHRVRGARPLLLVDEVQAMPQETVSELLRILEVSRSDAQLVAAGLEGDALAGVLQRLPAGTRAIRFDDPWSREEAELLVARIAGSLDTSVEELLAVVDLDAALSTSGGNPRLVRAALAVSLRKIALTDIEMPGSATMRPPPAAPPQDHASPAPVAALPAAPPAEEAPVATVDDAPVPAPPAEPAPTPIAARLERTRAHAAVAVHRGAEAASAASLRARAAAARALGASASAVRSAGSALEQGGRAAAHRTIAELRDTAVRSQRAWHRVPRVPARLWAGIAAALALLAAAVVIGDRAPRIAAEWRTTAGAAWSRITAAAAPAAPEPAPAPVATAAAPPAEPILFRVNSTPWANVEIDGEPAGPTPLSIPLTPGKHKLRASMADGRVIEQEVEVSAERDRIAFR